MPPSARHERRANAGPPARHDPRDLARVRTVANALSSVTARWWVDHGTLLALVREGRPFSWDDDVDLSYDDRDHALVVSALLACKHDLAARLLVTRRYVKIVPYAAGERVIDVAGYRPLADGSWEKRLLRSEPTSGGSARAQFTVIRWVGRLIDSTVGVADRLLWMRGRPPPPIDAWSVALGGTVARLRDRFGRAQPSYVPPGHFERLDEVAWESLRLPSPGDPPGYLALRYGPDWRVPKREWTWWDDDHTVTGASG